eukprot:3936255-Rhodomonas_salina.2
MESSGFIDAADTLILEDDEFHQLLNHPVLDNTASAAFKQHVVTLCVNHGLVFPVAADNANPASPAKFLRNYNYIVKSLKSIQSQISDACSTTMEIIFVREQRECHPLKPMRIWKRMSDSFHKVAARDRGSLMTDLQSHAMTIQSWELDDLTDWIEKTIHIV